MQVGYKEMFRIAAERRAQAAEAANTNQDNQDWQSALNGDSKKSSSSSAVAASTASEPESQAVTTTATASQQAETAPAQDGDGELSFREATLRYVMRRMIPLMATNIIEPKSQAEFDAVGLGQEWQVKQAQWQNKLAGMTEEARAASGVALNEEVEQRQAQSSTAAQGAEVRSAATAVQTPPAVQAAAPASAPQAQTVAAVQSTQNTAATAQVQSPPVNNSTVETQQAAADVQDGDGELSFREATLRYVMRRMIPLMATNIIEPKSQAEFDAVGLGQEWQVKQAQWQNKLAGMTEEARAASGVALNEEVEQRTRS